MNDNRRAKKKQSRLGLPAGCLVAFGNLVVLWFIVLGLYGISTPNPNAPTSFVIGVPTDMFFLFMFVALPGGICLFITWSHGWRTEAGVVVALAYFSLVFFFARLTAKADAEHRETVNEMRREWSESGN